jgi:hypothetical protein
MYQLDILGSADLGERATDVIISQSLVEESLS